jgi:hypothetical protein
MLVEADDEENTQRVDKNGFPCDYPAEHTPWNIRDDAHRVRDYDPAMQGTQHGKEILEFVYAPEDHDAYIRAWVPPKEDASDSSSTRRHPGLEVVRTYYTTSTGSTVGVCGFSGCGRVDELKKCACETVMYCTKQCQIGAWQSHKAACKRARAPPARVPRRRAECGIQSSNVRLCAGCGVVSGVAYCSGGGCQKAARLGHKAACKAMQLKLATAALSISPQE